jgi:amylosucrase
LLRAPLQALYGEVADIDALMARLIDEVTRAAQLRKPSLRHVDAQREINPQWFQDSSLIGYVAYANRFGDTISGVAEHLDYLAELQVGVFHLMQVLRPREGANDGGFAVLDYGDVDPRLGTRADLESLADQLRQRGISLCLDLVMNHTAAEHEWAQHARGGSQQHRDYYLLFPDRTLPDQFERSLPEVFPEIAPGNFTFDDELQAWVWTTFNTYQWDLNYANPDVLVEMLRVMVDLANLGVEILRLDAVAFTWKRMGTDCQNQPEAHLIAQIYRALLAIAAPGTLLLAEAIVAPADLLPYLGVHRNQRPECHLAYHNQLMVNIWSALASGDAALAAEALSALPATPESANWLNYVRCHDDIGWAISDADAGRLGLSGHAHRSFLAEFYRGDFPGSFANGAAFSSNPANGDERTCGTAAALCGVGAARFGNDPASIDRALRRLELTYGVMFGFAGIPLIYMGDELALDNDLSYLDDPDHADDSRWMHRPQMPWPVADRRKRAGTVEARMFGMLRRLIDVRTACSAMHAGGQTWIHRHPDTAVLAWLRVHPEHGRFYGVANFADRQASIPATALEWAGIERPRELLGTGAVTLVGDTLSLAPHGLAWFVDDADTAVQPPRPDHHR